MDLVRDLLDKPVADRRGREMGRVDRLVVEARDDAPPRIVAMEIGPSVLASRIGPTWGRWVAALEHGLNIDAGRPFRIPWSEVRDVDEQVTVDLAFGETPAATVEQNVRRWFAKLPFSS